MNEKDDIILEYLADIGVAEPLQVIYFNLKERGISFSKSTARRRLERLEEADLVNIAREKGTYYETKASSIWKASSNRRSLNIFRLTVSTLQRPGTWTRTLRAWDDAREC